jgi:HSP20 family molecular chaperone IbpA
VSAAEKERRATMSETSTTRRDAEKMAERPTVAPPVDIFEDKDQILILADVPGVTPEGFSIHLDRDQLTIEARRPRSAAGEDAFDYRRTFVVPHGVEADKIGAKLQNGVLHLTLPKPAALRPRQIEVKAS